MDYNNLNQRKMKKYFVARVHESGYSMPSIVFNTDSREDADQYAAIMRRNEDKEFIVLTLE